jgi:DNA-binding response OmpR family regulator
MHILIVESKAELGRLWQRHLERHGHKVDLAENAGQATSAIGASIYQVILVLDGHSSTLGIADYARLRQPQTNLVFVSDSTFFSAGMLFAASANARTLVRSETDPQDLAAIVEYYGCHA